MTFATSGDPQRYALFGSPIDRSPSPAMHNRAFATLGINASYHLRPAGPEAISELLEELSNGTWAGANVTTPLKTQLAQHVPLWGAAARAGAVNTLWRDGGQLVGALTDVDGVVAPIRGRHLLPLPHPNGSCEGLVVGAGGAARAAVLALEELGCRVHIAARQPEKAEQLCEYLSPELLGKAWDLDDTRGLSGLFGSLSVIVQATPVGRQGERHDLPWKSISPGSIAFEMLYLPRQTPFLKSAESAGCVPIEGWEMLLAQGAAAFSLWTGQAGPEQEMRDALHAALAQAPAT